MKTDPFKYILMGLALTTFSLLQLITPSKNTRLPLSSQKQYEIHLQNLELDPSTRLKFTDQVFIRLVFSDESEIEIGRDNPWTLNPENKITLDQKIDIDPEWIQEDTLTYKLQLVQRHKIFNKFHFERTLVSCSTHAKDISIYNRSYQCFIPREKTALFTYRVAEKGVPAPRRNRIAKK